MLRMVHVAVLSSAMAFAVAQSAAAAVPARQPLTLESFVGTWEGAAQTPNGDVPLRSAFKMIDGRLAGLIESSMGPIPVTAAAIQADKLVVSIEFQGTPGSLSCALKGDRLEGTWAVGGNGGTFWLARSAAGAGAGGNGVVGAWAGEVLIGGQAMPFNLALRESAGALAGEIGSGEGSVPLGKVTWSDGTLQLEFTYVGGQPVAMSGKLEGGKLVGTVDFNRGEAAGTWTASRKHP